MVALNSIVSRKISVSGLNVMSVPVFLALPMTCKFLDRLAALKFHVMHLAVARDLHLEPFAHRVHAFRADAVRAAGKFVAALAVFAAGVQRRQNHFDAGQILYSGWMSTGMPRPLSRTEIEPSTWMVTSILSQ